MNKKRLVFILGNLTSFGPFITDFYLPCLPELTAYFGGSASLIQLSLTAGMLGLAAVLLTSSGELKALILIAAIFIVSAIGFRLIFSKNDPAEDASSPEPEEKQEGPHE